EPGSRMGDTLMWYQTGREGRKPIVLAIGPSVLDGDVLALNETRVAQPLPKRRHDVRICFGRSVMKETDGWPLRLLRARHKRPRGYRAAEQRDELAPSHSITSSARARKDSGIVRPIAFAALTLTTRSNLLA